MDSLESKEFHWRPSPKEFVRIHLFHHPEFRIDPLVRSGAKAPHGWRIKHGALGMVLNVIQNKHVQFSMYQARVLIDGHVHLMGGKWIRSLKDFDKLLESETDEQEFLQDSRCRTRC